MRKVRTFEVIFLAFMILVPAYLLSSNVSRVFADSGSANVYILALSDVPCGEFGYLQSTDWRDQTENGAIAALTCTDNNALPFVHPSNGTSPPFYSTNFQVITDWSTYANVVEQASNVIIVDCHGEILPVPSGFSCQDWVAVIANAVLNRSVTWVHTGGYAFYDVWYQGASQSSLWGAYGFDNFTQFIGVNSTNCMPPPG